MNDPFADEIENGVASFSDGTLQAPALVGGIAQTGQNFVGGLARDISKLIGGVTRSFGASPETTNWITYGIMAGAAYLGWQRVFGGGGGSRRRR